MGAKTTFLLGLGAGYVLGTRSGRERYDQLTSKAQELMHDERVQEKAAQMQQVVMSKMGSKSSSTDDLGGVSTGTMDGTATGGEPR